MSQVYFLRVVVLPERSRVLRRPGFRWHLVTVFGVTIFEGWARTAERAERAACRTNARYVRAGW